MLLMKGTYPLVSILSSHTVFLGSTCWSLIVSRLILVIHLFFEMTDEANYDMQYVSSIPYYDLDNDDVSIIEPSIDIISDPPTTVCPEFVDPTSQYLYALDLHLQTTQSNHSSYYNSSQSSEFEQLRAHMDAGSMASTTNHLDFISNFQSLHGSTTTLWVADDTPHHPTGVRYLTVPILESPGFTSVCLDLLHSELASHDLVTYVHCF